MPHQTTPERMSAALRQARQRWRRELRQAVETVPTAAPAASPWTIAISREAGTNAREIADLVAAERGWIVYDRELLDEIARQAELRLDLVTSLDERPRPRGRIIPRPQDEQARRASSQYFQALTEVITSLATHGECILIGRGAGMILPAETTLSVRLVAPVSERIAAVRARRGWPISEARRWVEETDRERREFAKQHFLHDPDQASLYDLVLNVARLTQAQCAELMVTALKRLAARE